MELFINILLIIHVSAGFISIFLFWLPMITKKGSKLHKKSGKLYVYAMWVVTITAAILSAKNVLIGDYPTAIFLGFISLITAKPLWHGISILNKGADLEKIRKIKTALNFGIVGWAIFMLIYATLYPSFWNVLMYIFAILGFTALPELIRGLKKVTITRNKIQIHAIEMTTTAISAYTAFFAFGGREFFSSFLTGSLMIIPWVLPGVLGGIANVYFGKKYASKKKVATS